MAHERKKSRLPEQAPDAGKRILGIRMEHLLLLAIFLFAIFLRLQADVNIPYHYDPGKNIVYARAAVDSFPFVPQYNPYFNLGEYYEYQVLFPYTVAVLHVLSGISLVTLTTWFVILAGAALCLTVYFLSRELFQDTTAALISAFVIAASKIQLMAYMNYYPQILAMTLMPLACVFLIRYMRSQKTADLILVTFLSALIVLASYISAMVYFLLLCVSLAIWGIRHREAFRTLALIVLVTGALLAFFWLPIAWRYGTVNFVASAGSTALSLPEVPFTNVPWTLLDYFSSSGITVIILILALAALYLIRKITWDFRTVLLASWLGVSFLLMESYLIRPVLWSDRYAQFLDIAVLLLAGILLSFFIRLLNAPAPDRSRTRGYLLLLLLLIPTYGALHTDTVFGRWGYPSDIAALEYMQGLPEGALVVAPPSIHSFWVSALSGVHVLGGESSQIIWHKFKGDRESGLILSSPSVEEKMRLIRKYGVNYVLIPYHDSLPMVWNPTLNQTGIDAFNNSTYFEVERYFPDRYGSTVLLRVKENLTPRYQVQKTETGITIVAYLISLLTAAGCLYLCTGKKVPGLPGKKSDPEQER